MKTVKIAAVDAEFIVTELEWAQVERGDLAFDAMAKVEAAVAELGAEFDEDDSLTFEVSDDEAVVISAAAEAAGVDADIN